MRLALFPDADGAYHCRMMDGFKEGFGAADETLDVLVFRSPLGRVTPAIDWKSAGVNVVVQINAPRPPDLPQSVRHICWIQDVFPGLEQSIVESAQDQDIVYTIGDPDLLGLRREWPCFSSVLFTGVSGWWAQEPPAVVQDLDFSIVGHIPAKIDWYFSDHANAVAFRRWVESLYKPLTGSLDLRRLHKITKDENSRAAAREYVRFLDRYMLVELAASVSQKIELYGRNWHYFEELRPVARPYIRTDDGLRTVYQRSAINLSSNSDGFGVHSRQLECMAAGGFIMIHRSPMEYRAGGMRAHFEPNVHYAEYSVEGFKGEAESWLKRREERKAIGASARQLVLQNHSWRHRAQQVLDDLKRTG